MVDFFSSTAMAQAQEAAKAAQPSMLENMLPFLFIFIAMYFIMIRPQTKKAKEHARLLENLKSGDEVVTSGGIIGRVRNVTDEFVTLDLGSTQMKVVKDHISRFTKKLSDGDSTAASKPKVAEKKR